MGACVSVIYVTFRYRVVWLDFDLVPGIQINVWVKLCEVSEPT